MISYKFESQGKRMFIFVQPSVLQTEGQRAGKSISCIFNQQFTKEKQWNGIEWGWDGMG